MEAMRYLWGHKWGRLILLLTATVLVWLVFHYETAALVYLALPKLWKEKPRGRRYAVRRSRPRPWSGNPVVHRVRVPAHRVGV